MPSDAAVLAYEFVDDIMISASGDGPMADAPWDDYLRAADAFLVSRPDSRNIVVTGDSKVSAAQRQRLSDMIKRRGAEGQPTVVITGSVVARGVITALNWLLKRDVKTFSPARLDDALDRIGIPAQDRVRVGAKVRAVAARAGVRGLGSDVGRGDR